MAHILNQVVVQDDQNNLPKRVIIQWTDDVTGDMEQKIVDYSTMSAADQTTYDNFIAMSEALMNI